MDHFPVLVKSVWTDVVRSEIYTQECTSIIYSGLIERNLQSEFINPSLIFFKIYTWQYTSPFLTLIFYGKYTFSLNCHKMDKMWAISPSFNRASLSGIANSSTWYQLTPRFTLYDQPLSNLMDKITTKTEYASPHVKHIRLDYTPHLVFLQYKPQSAALSWGIPRWWNMWNQ